LDVLKLVFKQRNTNRPGLCRGWKFDKKKGLVLFWWSENKEGVNVLPDMTAEQVFPLVEAWLQSDEASTVELKSWDTDSEHDGSNGPGWRVYCEDWGHVGNESCSICAITPAFMWYGK
jgi:hypothetical protein